MSNKTTWDTPCLQSSVLDFQSIRLVTAKGLRTHWQRQNDTFAWLAGSQWIL